MEIGDEIEGYEWDAESDTRIKHILKVINVSGAGVYAINNSPFSKPHKDAKFFKFGDFKIYGTKS